MLLKVLKQYIVDFWHLVFPAVCTLCEDEIKLDNLPFCINCHASFSSFNNIEGNRENKITNTLYGSSKVEKAFGLYYLNKNSIVEKLIYSFKYKNISENAIWCGCELGELLNQVAVEINHLIPAPTTKKRKHQRGYNQTLKISEGIQSSYKGKCVISDILEIQSQKKSATNKNRADRYNSLLDKISVKKGGQISGNILIVDDVITTGATIDACMRAIVQKYPEISIYLAVVGVATR